MRRVTLAILGLAAVIFGGCTPKVVEGPSLPDKDSSGKSVTIVVIPRDSKDFEQSTAKMGAETAANDLGRTMGVKVNIDWRPAKSATADAQIKAIEDATAMKPDAILVDCIDGAALAPAIDKAAEAKIAVMTYEVDSPNSKRFCYYGLDDFAAGQRLMRDIATRGGVKGNVAIYGGDPKSPFSSRRVEGILSEGKKTPGINVVGVFTGSETTQDSENAIRKAMSEHSDIDAWVLVGPWALDNEAFLKYLDPGKVKVIALGCTGPSLRYAEKGAVLYATPTYQLGYKSVQTVVQKLVQNSPVTPIINVELNPERVATDNVKTWASNLTTWGYPNVPKDILFMQRKKLFSENN
jgi:ribose transport system substrate-binding protein